MAVTPLDVEQARMDARQNKNQQRMEKDVFGQATTLPGKPGKATVPSNLPGKAEKKKPFGEGMTNYRKGGYVRAADGIAKKGKTKGRIL